MKYPRTRIVAFGVCRKVHLVYKRDLSFADETWFDGMGIVDIGGKMSRCNVGSKMVVLCPIQPELLYTRERNWHYTLAARLN